MRSHISLAAMLVVGSVSLVACAGETSFESGDLEGAIKSSSELTLNDALGKQIKDAYVFCEYANSKDGPSRGFSEDQFFSIRGDYKKWESYTGIGVVPESGESEIYWFSPKEINACPGGKESLTHLNGDSVIKTSVEKREFTDGSTTEVHLLHY